MYGGAGAYPETEDGQSGVGLSRGAPGDIRVKTSPTPYLTFFCLRGRTGAALLLISSLLSPGAPTGAEYALGQFCPRAPRHSPTPYLEFCLRVPPAQPWFPSFVSWCDPAQPYTWFSFFCLRVRPGGALHPISSILYPVAPRRILTPSFHFSVSGSARQSPTPDFPLLSSVRPGAALHLISPSAVSGCAPAPPAHLISSILSPGAPRRSPTPSFHSSLSGCARAAPYIRFPVFCPRVRPGAALYLVFTLLSLGAPRRSPIPDFPLLSPGAPPAHTYTLFPVSLRVRPGAALHPDFLSSVPGAPRHSPTPGFHSSVSGCAPAQPYT
ncbi:hypothetical protein CDAR_114461 [Caerostris darwini]|uniref:Uncharacterized protein n=1 Tax=Caerostris darwini TaxID=1538125 RepID=A0AAV4R7L3_9ARAC|nr:hypothetical protein CDAR_114461 [Caerostris darwini]